MRPTRPRTFEEETAPRPPSDPTHKPKPQIKMKKLLFTLTLSIALALGAQPAFAQAKKKPADAAKPAVEAPKTAPDAAKAAADAKAKAATDKPIPMYARADEIDVKGKTFTQINKDGTKAKHTLSAETTIMNGEAAAKLSDIKVGEYVSGLRKKSADGYDVVKITKFGPKAPKPAVPGKVGTEPKPAK